MSLVRRFQLVFSLIAAVVVLALGAGTAGANPTAPTIPAEVSERVVTTDALDGGAGFSEARAVRGTGSSASASASDSQVLDDVLAQTGSSMGLLVISGAILLIIGGSLLGGRRVYGD